MHVHHGADLRRSIERQTPTMAMSVKQPTPARPLRNLDRQQLHWPATPEHIEMPQTDRIDHGRHRRQPGVSRKPGYVVQQPNDRQLQESRDAEEYGQVEVS